MCERANSPMQQDVAGGVPAQQVVHEGDGDARAGGLRGERQPREALGEGGRRVGGHKARRQEHVHQLEESRPVLCLQKHDHLPHQAAWGFRATVVWSSCLICCANTVGIRHCDRAACAKKRLTTAPRGRAASARASPQMCGRGRHRQRAAWPMCQRCVSCVSITYGPWYGANSHLECISCEQAVQALIKGGVLEPVLGHQYKNPVEGQHAHHAACGNRSMDDMTAC